MTSDIPKPELPGTPKPPKVYPGLNRRLRIAMWLAFLGGLVMIAIGGYGSYQSAKLKSQGVQVPGILVDSNTPSTGKGRTSYRITLDYKSVDNEITYRKEFVVSEAVYSQARQAGQVPVIFLPSDPTVSAAGGRIDAETEPFAIGAGLLVFAFALRYYLRREMRKVEAYITAEA